MMFAGAVPPGPFTGVTLAEVAIRLRDGLTDPVDLVDRALAAIDASQPLINAFVTVDHEGARAAAAKAAVDLATGVDRGPLHGVPVAVKDNVDTAGLVTTMGSRHFSGHVPERDAEVVRRLRAAGAIVVGKTTLHEFAYGNTGDIAVNGACANPHDPTRMAGGSSAGSAAAVAAGLVPLAVGTDTGGSVRVPAALCGTVGIRPSMGRIPTDGVFPLSWSLDTVGVFAADVVGAALGWRILAGVGPVAPHVSTAGAEPGTAGADQVRLGVVVGAWFDRLDPGVRAAFEAFVARLPEVVPVSMPDAAELATLYRVIQSAEAVAVHHDRMANAPELFDPEVRQRLQAAAEVPAHEYAEALRRMAKLRGTARERLAGVDALILPTVPVLAPPMKARDADIGGGWTSPRDALLAHDTPYSVLGLPALSLPIGTVRGLPVGAQLVGRPAEDEALLASAHAVERFRQT